MKYSVLGFYWKKRPHYVAQADLEHTESSLPLPPKFWG